MKELLKPGERFMEYRIEDVIDAGGMGVVYRASEPYSGDVVAIKCRLPCHDGRDDYTRRFEQECKFYPLLRHPNIVRTRRAGKTPSNVPFIVMDLLEGNTLRKIVTNFGASGRRMDVLLVLHIMIQVADAMAFVHSKGIMHRDLKLENIMVGTRGSEKGHVWLVDFGIAKMERGGLVTEDLPAVGTVAYLSPEQAREICGPAKDRRRSTVDKRADIYAFGAIFYEALTNEHIFLESNDPRSAEEIVAGHLTAEPKPVHEVVEGCPIGLSAIVSKCLEKDPGARFQTADKVLDALREQMVEVTRTRAPDPMVVRKAAEEEAQAARLLAFRSMPSDEGEEAAAAVQKHGEPMSQPVQSVTAELPDFVQSGSALPFGRSAAGAFHVPVPVLRGKGHTVRIPRAALPPTQLPATTQLPNPTSAPQTTSIVTSTPTSTPSAIATRPTQTTPLTMTRAPSQPSFYVLVAVSFAGLGCLLAGVALIVALRARPSSLPLEAASVTPTPASASASSAASSVLAAPTASPEVPASVTSIVPSSVVLPSPTSDMNAVTPAIDKTAQAASPPKPKRPPPPVAKPASTKPKFGPLFDDLPPPQPKGRR